MVVVVVLIDAYDRQPFKFLFGLATHDYRRGSPGALSGDSPKRFPNYVVSFDGGKHTGEEEEEDGVEDVHRGFIEALIVGS